MKTEIYPPLKPVRMFLMAQIADELTDMSEKELKKLIIQQAGFITIMHDNVAIATPVKIQEQIHKFLSEYLLPQPLVAGNPTQIELN